MCILSVKSTVERNRIGGREQWRLFQGPWAGALIVACASVMSSNGQEPGWIPLFDGKTLNGWTTIGGVNWTVVDGAISATPAAQPISPTADAKQTWPQGFLRSVRDVCRLRDDSGVLERAGHKQRSVHPVRGTGQSWKPRQLLRDQHQRPARHLSDRQHRRRPLDTAPPHSQRRQMEPVRCPRGRVAHRRQSERRDRNGRA